jgi:hypothetical protein
MANDLETPNLGNFSIQDTMEMGVGSTELLNDLKDLIAKINK